MDTLGFQDRQNFTTPHPLCSIDHMSKKIKLQLFFGSNSTRGKQINPMALTTVALFWQYNSYDTMKDEFI